ncbi:putative F-box domain, leucine-rich repeat domain, L domain-containing protein [Lupinus albus]|uniref:Putative F-box domain, leucine-rich repeat domain, L domain-containing protein n=1 Tax=Lupinus albus TaxID=3870 RepID=A0A6A4QXU0_LUPAL|nr:putative F-box domain, leucine-rich repeat domain, L domain-containing protein [Lupinus albus]
MSKFSHKNENSDFISHLPEPIMHYILSLFNNKECARTCVLSKTWKNVYYSKPNMLFHEEDFIPSNSFINSLEGRNLFLNYVDQSLNRAIEMKSNHLERFELHLTLCDPDGIPQSNVVNQLLRKVFGLGVKTMSLILDFLDNPSHLVLESKTLIEVHLDCFSFIKACKTINFPHLRVLSLFHIDLPNKALEMLISGCPCVEVLRLSHCSTSQNLQLLGLTKLVEITVSFCRDVETVEIRSLFCQNIYVIDDCNESATITLLGCETMSNLHLNVWLSNEFSEFKWLVELKLMNLVIKGRISSQSIKRLVIRHCTAETEMVQICCQNLLSLEYEANDIPFHFDGLCDLRDFTYGFSLLQNGRYDQINSLEKLFGSTFNVMKNLKMVILLGPLKVNTLILNLFLTFDFYRCINIYAFSNNILFVKLINIFIISGSNYFGGVD